MGRVNQSAAATFREGWPKLVETTDTLVPFKGKLNVVMSLLT